MQALREALAEYRSRVWHDVNTSPIGAKLWWKRVRELCDAKQRVQGIPALHLEDGSWALRPELKADAFAVAFSQKWRLPEQAMGDPLLQYMFPVEAHNWRAHRE